MGGGAVVNSNPGGGRGEGFFPFPRVHFCTLPSTNSAPNTEHQTPTPLNRRLVQPNRLDGRQQRLRLRLACEHQERRQLELHGAAAAGGGQAHAHTRAHEDRNRHLPGVGGCGWVGGGSGGGGGGWVGGWGGGGVGGGGGGWGVGVWGVGRGGLACKLTRATVAASTYSLRPGPSARVSPHLLRGWVSLPLLLLLIPAPTALITQALLRVRYSSPLFRLAATADVIRQLAFHNTGPQQVGVWVWVTFMIN